MLLASSAVTDSNDDDGERLKLSLSSYGRRALSMADPAIWNWFTRQYERPGHQQRLLQTFTEDVLIFSLLVYIAH